MVEERNSQIVVMADKWELVNGRRLQMPAEVLENTDMRVVVVWSWEGEEQLAKLLWKPSDSHLPCALRQWVFE